MMSASASRISLSPLNFLHRRRLVMAERTAVVQGDRRYTYAELGERAARLAAALRAKGLEKGDRVAVLCPNSPAILEAHYGVPAAEGILVTINTRLSAGEVEYIIGDCEPKLVIVDRELEELVPDDAPKLVVHDTGEEGDPYEDFLAEAEDAEPIGPWEGDEDDPISINYTSGTTGKPKGAVYTHRGAYLRALGAAMETGMNARTVHLWTLPMFHCNGWCLTWGVTAAGGRHVCLRKVEPERIWKLLVDERVTHYSGAPTIHINLVNHDDATELEQEVTVPTGGSPPSPALLKKMRELNLHPVHLYGLTETYGPVMGCTALPEWDDKDLDEQAKLNARQGTTYNCADLVRVVNDDMEDVPADAETLGEIVMRGNSVMAGYWNMDDETEEAFQGDWFHSGDIGVMHPDGYVELRDRGKDVIISGGENISSVEVEQVISGHEAVVDAAVVATPDEKWGERPKAFVELKDGQDLSEDDLISYCRDNLAKYKCPAAVEFGELPRTSTGKVQKFKLREQEWEGKERAIG
jgi:fatty-acyl-CoA synthase